MQNVREATASMFGALLICGGLLLLSTSIVMWDLSSLRKKVEQLFAVDFLSIPAPAPVLQQQAVELAGRQLVDESIGLFAKQPETPEVDTAMPENLPAPETPRVTLPAQAVAGLSLPEAELPELAGIEIRKGGGGGEAEVLALRRKLTTPAADAREEYVRRNARRETGHLAAELPKLPAFTPALPERPAPVAISQPAQPQLGDGGFSLPGGEGALMRDLVRFRPSGGYPSLDHQIGAEFSLEPSGGASYFRLSFRLRQGSSLPVLPKDVLFLVDVSQSIRLEQIQAAREAIASYVQQMRPGDRWNVVKFSERVHSLAPDFGFLAAGERLAEAQRFIRRIPDENMTDLFEATRSILRNVPESTRPCNVFLLSDGQANYNRKEVGQITDGFQRVNRDNFSIFTFMSGRSGKPDLLRLLSYRSRGFFDQAPLGGTLAGSMLGFFLAYDRPVLSCCVANYTNLEASEVYPQVLPNLYIGQAVTFHGRVRNAGDFVVRVMGLAEGGEAKEFYFRPQGVRVSEGTGIREEWARGRAYGMVQDIIDAHNDTARRQELSEFRSFITTENLTDLTTMGQLLEKGR